MNYDKYSGINDFPMPLFYIYSQTFAGTYPFRDHGLAYRKASAACRAGEKKRKDIHKVQSSLTGVNLPQMSQFYV